MQDDFSSAFGIDRTNSNNAIGAVPRPSKRPTAGRNPSIVTSTQEFPTGFHEFNPSAAPWVHPATHQQPLQSPTLSGAPAMPLPSGSPTGAPNPAQIEAFKTMVFQMANFFKQYPEANVPQGVEGWFNQLSVSQGGDGQATEQSQPHPAMAHGLHPAQHVFTQPIPSADDFLADIPPATQMNVQGPPKPNRRAYASANNISQPDTTSPSSYGSQPIRRPLHNNERPPSTNNNNNTRGLLRPRSTGANSGSYTQSFQTHDTAPKIILLVEFKRQRMKKYESDFFVTPGNYVIVEGDRGLDCGFVIHSCVREADGTFSRQESIDNVQVDVNRMKSESGHCVRVARDDDVHLLHHEIASSEHVALKTCRDLAVRMNLNMEIVDCEYQFDRKKISFYFEAPHSVDFRELNTELFRIFGVRIWLENLNSKVKNVVPDGALSHADKLQYKQNGLRPPRRT